MFFRKARDIQRLNLEPPTGPPDAPPSPPPQDQTAVPPDPNQAKAEEVNRRAAEILKSGRIPDTLFVCQVSNGLLSFRPGGDHGFVMLLFSTPFAARDYLRVTETAGTMGQFPVAALSQLAQTWSSSGVKSAAFDRCPRCPQFLMYPLPAMIKWTREDFAKVWSVHRATRVLLGEIRVRSAIAHLAVGAHAAARADFEYVRDHFDCSIPYLHQMIGMIAGLQQDEAAVTAAKERLKEFGPSFEGPLEITPQTFATASVGLMMNFGIVPAGTNANAASGGASAAP